MSDKIWTPPTPLDENVKRMAWLLFLEWWKTEMQRADLSSSPDAALFSDDEAERAYRDCLDAAKLVRGVELQGDRA